VARPGHPGADRHAERVGVGALALVLLARGVPGLAELGQPLDLGGLGRIERPRMYSATACSAIGR
jgi:hypothetical protein